MNRNSCHEKDPRRRGNSERTEHANRVSVGTPNPPILGNPTEFPNFSIPPPMMISCENRFPVTYPPFVPQPMWPNPSFHPYVATNPPYFPSSPIPLPPYNPPPNLCSVSSLHTVLNKQIVEETPQVLRSRYRDTEDTYAMDFTFNDLENQFFSTFKERAGNEPQVQLWRASYLIQEYYKLMKTMEKDLETLKLCYNSESDEKWNQLCETIGETQIKLKTLKDNMNFSPPVLQLLKHKWNKRKKKRKRKARMKLSTKKVPSKYEIADLHMQQLLQNAKRIEQEQTLKREADSVLSSVLLKKSEAHNQIQLLTMVLKLHSTRVQLLNTGNQSSTISSISGFQKIIEKLITLWKSQEKEYEVEENGLKIMLKESAINADDEDCKNLKKTFGRWLKLIFGTVDSQNDLYYSNMDQFIEIRQGWDKYVVENPSEGSKIPRGWIVPKYNHADSWTKFVTH